MRIIASTKSWSLRMTLIAVALAIAAVVTPVLADSIYPTRNATWLCPSWGPLTPGAQDLFNLYCMTDNSALYWAEDDSLNLAQVGLINTVLEREYETTDLFVAREPAKYDGSNQTDIIFGIRSNVAEYAQAITWCDTQVDSQRCDQHYVMFKGPEFVTEHHICHETGHAVGLVHANEMSPPLDFSSGKLGCMGTSGNSLTTEMKAEINRVY